MIKKVLFMAAVIATTMSYGQIDVAYSGSTTTIDTEGTTDSSIIITLSNVPYDSGVTINSRVYTSGTAVSGSGHVGTCTALSLDQAFTDVDNGLLKTVTVLGTSDVETPAVGFFDREYTIKSYNVISEAAGGTVDFAIRFVGAFNVDPVLSFVQTPESGGNANNASFILTTGVSVIAAPVASVDDDAIENLKVYPNPTTGILHISDVSDVSTINIVNVLGQVVRVFEGTTSIDISDLKAGVYFLQADNGLKRKIVKK